MKTLVLLIPSILLLLIAVGLGPRIAKDIHKKVRMPNTYAIVNAATGKVKGARKTGPRGKLRIHPKKGPRNVQRTTYIHGRV